MTVVQLSTVGSEAGQIDGAAQGTTKFVTNQFGDFVRVAVEIDVLTGTCDTESIVAVGFIESAVEFISAAFGGDDNRGRGVVPGRGGAGFHPDFADGVEALLVHGTAEFAVVRGRTILNKAGAVDHEAARTNAAIDVNHLFHAGGGLLNQGI